MEERKAVRGTDLPETQEENVRASGEPEQKASQGYAVSETWAEETIADLDDFIESQGIYIRQ